MGENPPFHTPVIVLTHRARAPIEMAGGTTFYFVREGIRAALERAAAAAKDKEVRIGGGAATVQQFLCAGLIDELHFAISPILLGSGEALSGGINLVELRYRSREQKGTSNAMHVILSKEK